MIDLYLTDDPSDKYNCRKVRKLRRKALIAALRAEALESPITASIRAQISGLGPAEAKVAKVLLGEAEGLIYISASDVAAQAGAALSTVVRTCQKLGFRGFQDLKIALARERRLATPAELQEDVQPSDTPAVVLTKVAAAARAAVDLGVAHIDSAAFESAVRILAVASRVLCVGVGSSGPLAQDVAYHLMWIGVAAEAPADVHVQHVRATLLKPQDVALVVSHTGSTRETVSVAQAAKRAGAKIIAITSFARSPLTEVADIVLVAASRETAYRVEALASRISHLTVIDALWVATAVTRGEEAIAYARAVADVITDHRF
jgi:DNA-binding MurR/RpiR family transcriptional regulator